MFSDQCFVEENICVISEGEFVSQYKFFRVDFYLVLDEEGIVVNKNVGWNEIDGYIDLVDLDLMVLEDFFWDKLYIVIYFKELFIELVLCKD